jgi:molecular chaperone GrpE (heat shock protein)
VTGFVPDGRFRFRFEIMRKRFLVLSLLVGLVMLLGGAGALGWVFAEHKKEKQLLREHQQRLSIGLDELNKVVTGEIDVHSFAKLVPQENRQQQLDKYRARAETRELILVVSIVCVSAGVTVLGWCLLLWVARVLIRGLSYLTRLSRHVFQWGGKIEDERLAITDAGEDEIISGQEQGPRGNKRRCKKHSKILTSSGWHNFGTDCANQYEPSASEKAFAVRSGPEFSEAEDADADRAAVSPARLWQGQLCKTGLKTTLLDSGDNYPELEGLLRSQTKNLEKQMVEFKQMAQSVQQTALEHSGPLKNNLEELVQEVSAIREYALQQQGRMERLQDGYDWNIIRTFCLRVIRCIDNLENRIAQLSRNNGEAKNLTEVRDELLFALESSGVERFEPKTKSDYRGQERKAEAIRDKHQCNDRNLKGKVAEVVRPGYQYVIDEENVKVVRTAQVKLFG